MRSSRSGLSGLLAAVTLGVIGAAAQQAGNSAVEFSRSLNALKESDARTTPARPQRISVTSSIERALLNRMAYSGNGRRTFPGYGWSVAHDRRMARKARNKARHRARAKR